MGGPARRGAGNGVHLPRSCVRSRGFGGGGRAGWPSTRRSNPIAAADLRTGHEIRIEVVGDAYDREGDASTVRAIRTAASVQVTVRGMRARPSSALCCPASRMRTTLLVGVGRMSFDASGELADEQRRQTPDSFVVLDLMGLPLGILTASASSARRHTEARRRHSRPHDCRHALVRHRRRIVLRRGTERARRRRRAHGAGHTARLEAH